MPRQDSGRETALVDAVWVAKGLETDANLRVLDLAFRKTNYKEGHIPGAQFVDWRADIISAEQSSFYQLPSQNEMEQLLSNLGITAETTVVLTDDMQNRSAVRMYFTLKYFGHEQVRILDGGTPAWVRAGMKLTQEVPNVKATKYKIRASNDDFVVSLEYVLKSLDSNPQIIDSRPRDQFVGEVPGKAFHTNRPHARKGHVPSALNIPWMENLNADGTFKSVAELRKLYESRGIDINAPVVAYCNEGLHAAMPWFVLRELLDSERATVYDNSMVEWSNRQDTPLEPTDK